MFDEMWDIPRFYISACSNSVQYVRLHPILISILLYDYKQLTEFIEKVEQMSTRVEVQEAPLQNRAEQDYSPPPPQQSKI